MKVSLAFATATLVAVATFVAVFTLGAVLYRSVYVQEKQASLSTTVAQEDSAHGLVYQRNRKLVDGPASLRNRQTSVDANSNQGVPVSPKTTSKQNGLVPALYVPDRESATSKIVVKKSTEKSLPSFRGTGRFQTASAIGPTFGSQKMETESSGSPFSNDGQQTKPTLGLADLMPPGALDEPTDNPPVLDDFLESNSESVAEFSSTNAKAASGQEVSFVRIKADGEWLLSLKDNPREITSNAGDSESIGDLSETSFEEEVNRVSPDAIVTALKPPASQGSASQVFASPARELIEGDPQNAKESLVSADAEQSPEVTTVSSTELLNREPAEQATATEIPQDLIETQDSGPAEATLTDAIDSGIALQQPVTNRPSTNRSPTRSMTNAKNEDSKVIGWPLPKALIADLEKLKGVHATEDWAGSAMQTFEALNQLEIADSRSLAFVNHIDQLADQLTQFSQASVNDANNAKFASYFFKVSLKMKRRAKLWQSVHRLAARDLAEGPESAPRTVADQISMRTSEVTRSNLDADWSKYLMLEQAQEVFSNRKSSKIQRQKIAYKVLARATSSSLTPQQTNYAQDLIGNDLGNVLRNVAIGTLDLGEFLNAVEAYEAKPTYGSTARLKHFYQGYYWNRDDQVQELSAIIDDEYRMANVRMQFSQRMINRLVPRTPTIQQPVSDLILDARVRGHSRISNQIQVQMVPDPNHLSFRLTSNGRVLSNTSAHARGFVFDTLGNALVNASKTVSIGEDGVQMRPTAVQATSQTRLTGIQSNFDAVPVVGWLARRMAQQQQQASGFKAKQIVESKLKSEFRSRIDSELEKGVLKAQSWVKTNVFDPLQRLELEPTVMHLQTESDSAIVKYRLASLDQIAADAPRPIVAANNLVSFQMHSSAVNNMINRLQLGGKKFTPDSFVLHLNKLIGQTKLTLADDSHDDVTFEFYKQNPIQLDFKEGRLEISLRLRKLQIGQVSRWNDLIVTAKYRPVAVGNHVFLTLDESAGLAVRARKRLRLGDQIAVRTVFVTLFQSKFDFALLPPELANHPAMQSVAVSQLGLSNGWLTLAFNEVANSNYGNGTTFQSQLFRKPIIQEQPRYDRPTNNRTGQRLYEIGDQHRYR